MAANICRSSWAGRPPYWMRGTLRDQRAHTLPYLSAEFPWSCSFHWLSPLSGVSFHCITSFRISSKGRSDDKYIATAHEYVLIYKKAEVVFGGWEPEEN